MMLMSTLNAELARIDGAIAKSQGIHLQATGDGDQAKAASSLARARALENQRRLLIDPEFFIPNDDL